MPRILILAYGNPLRSDDGVAWRIANQLRLTLPDVEIQSFHQLGPELAEAVTHFERVLFLDAASPREGVKPGQIRIEPVLPDATAGDASRFSHVVTPNTVVTLAATLYGVDVQAQLVTITGENFEHGESLSSPVTAALPALVAEIERIVRGHLENS